MTRADDFVVNRIIAVNSRYEEGIVHALEHDFFSRNTGNFSGLTQKDLQKKLDAYAKQPEYSMVPVFLQLVEQHGPKETLDKFYAGAPWFSADMVK